MQQDIGKNIICGGGISGLIWSFYNPEYTIISPDVGGQFGKTGMIWIHDTFETRKLLKDLGWEKPEQLAKKSYIGYYHNGWVSDFQTQEMNLLMIQKKMTNWNAPIDKDFIPKTRDLSLSVIGGSNYMNTLGVDLKELLDRLSKHSRIVTGKIVNITDKYIKVDVSNETESKLIELEYDKLVSTIPAPDFWKLYGEIREFKYLPITTIITENKPSFFDDRYEMIYYDETVPFSRVSHIDNKYALEFTGKISKDEFQKRFPELKVASYFVTEYGRIFENEENTPPQRNMTFSGRFSKWKYGITVEWVIKQVIDKLNEKN